MEESRYRDDKSLAVQRWHQRGLAWYKELRERGKLVKVISRDQALFEWMPFVFPDENWSGGSEIADGNPTIKIYSIKE